MESVMTEKSVTPDGISWILSNPNPDPATDIRVIVQALDIRFCLDRMLLTVSDGNAKLKSIIDSGLSAAIEDIQNLGLFCITGYTLFESQDKKEKFLRVTKYEVISPPLKTKIQLDSKDDEAEELLKLIQEATLSDREEVHVFLKPKQEVAKLASQVCVYNVEFTDEEGNRIESTVYSESEADLKVGKVYHTSKVTLKVRSDVQKPQVSSSATLQQTNSKCEPVSGHPAPVSSDDNTGSSEMASEDGVIGKCKIIEDIINELVNLSISEKDVGRAAEACYNDRVKAEVLFALPIHMRRSYVVGFLNGKN